MKKYCPNCKMELHNTNYCSLCGAKFKKPCRFHKWVYESESERVCKKCGSIQTKGLTYGWTNIGGY